MIDFPTYHTDAQGRKILFCAECLRQNRGDLTRQAVTITKGEAVCEVHFHDN